MSGSEIFEGADALASHTCLGTFVPKAAQSYSPGWLPHSPFRIPITIRWQWRTYVSSWGRHHRVGFFCTKSIADSQWEDSVCFYWKLGFMDIMTRDRWLVAFVPYLLWDRGNHTNFGQRLKFHLCPIYIILDLGWEIQPKSWFFSSLIWEKNKTCLKDNVATEKKRFIYK